jgi:phosphoserine phosphatase RsbU/P
MGSTSSDGSAMTSDQPSAGGRNEQLRKLTEIGRALTYARTMAEVLPIAVDGSAELMESTRSLIMLADETGQLRVRASKGVEEPRLSHDSLDGPLIERLERLLGDYSPECFLGVPLVARGVVTGLLAVIRPGDSPFDEEDEWLLSAAADAVSVSLESTRLAEEVRRHREEKRRAANDPGDEPDSSDRALATLSHDLRSPLNAIDSYAELIEMEIFGAISQRQREALGRIRMSGRHLLAVLENVLEMTRLSAGVVRIHATSVSAAAVVEEAVLMVEPGATERGQSVVTQQVSDTMLEADPDRLRQVLVNLLNNAIKYSGPGGMIRITAQTDHTDDRDWGAIVVADDGPGIPPEKLSMIFQPYYRLPGAESDAPEGVGLGLAISRELVRRMGGDIEVESVPGEGCAFKVRLPAAESPRGRS